MNTFRSSSKDFQLSKTLSWLLRHGAVKEGLHIEDGGFIEVQKILNLTQFKNYTVDDIVRVVNNCDKKRFTLRIKNQNCFQIRANQGHSVPVDDEKLLTLLTIDTVPPLIYHGTYLSKLEKIKCQGLSKIRRNHVHFTSCLPGERQIISGMRGNCDVIVAIDTLKAMNDGFQFYISDNGVILCKGNKDGLIPPAYFKEVIRRS